MQPFVRKGLGRSANVWANRHITTSLLYNFFTRLWKLPSWQKESANFFFNAEQNSKTSFFSFFPLSWMRIWCKDFPVEQQMEFQFIWNISLCSHMQHLAWLWVNLWVSCFFFFSLSLSFFLFSLTLSLSFSLSLSFFFLFYFFFFAFVWCDLCAGASQSLTKND